jgi:hypothetical protein
MRGPTILAGAVACGALLVGGCGGSGSPRLEGHWKGTAADGVPPEAQAGATAFAAAMDLVFKGDKVTITHQGKKTTSPYKVLKNDVDQITISAGGDKETFTVLSPDTMRWSVVQGRTITFQKQKK